MVVDNFEKAPQLRGFLVFLISLLQVLGLKRQPTHVNELGFGVG